MRTSRRVDKIGVVVHGPEVVDSGSALKLINYLKKFGNVAAVLGGTMGRLAVIDAGLEKVINISPRRTPSRSIKDLQSSADVIVVLNQAKTTESGLAFGYKVAANAGTDKPLIQIDCGGRFVARLCGKDYGLAESFAKDLRLDLISHDHSVDRSAVVREGNIVKRKLTGVLPGELISVNGIVVARATDSSVEIHALHEKIVAVKGADLKFQGIEKLPPLDLEKAIIRSGDIRRTEAKPRVLECKGDEAAIIDHCAEDAFETAKGACVAVTVGDDTTAISGDILARFDTPVIGIVDGDLDKLSHNTTVAKGSIIIRVEPGYDDVIGRRVRDELFKGKSRGSIRSSDHLAQMVIGIADSLIVQIERL